MEIQGWKATSDESVGWHHDSPRQQRLVVIRSLGPSVFLDRITALANDWYRRTVQLNAGNAVVFLVTLHGLTETIVLDRLYQTPKPPLIGTTLKASLLHAFPPGSRPRHAPWLGSVRVTTCRCRSPETACTNAATPGSMNLLGAGSERRSPCAAPFPRLASRREPSRRRHW